MFGIESWNVIPAKSRYDHPRGKNQYWYTGFYHGIKVFTKAWLRSMYDDVHLTSDLQGKCHLSPTTISDLDSWIDYLKNPTGNASPIGYAVDFLAMWGDGSGSGTGGTLESFLQAGVVETWQGVWSQYFGDSNWRELRTVAHGMERILADPNKKVEGTTILAILDNLVSYYVLHNGCSKNPALNELVRYVKNLERQLKCRLEPIHFPGTVLIQQGTDGLSRGVWMMAESHSIVGEVTRPMQKFLRPCEVMSKNANYYCNYWKEGQRCQQNYKGAVIKEKAGDRG